MTNKDDKYHNMHVLDKLMENVTMWVKMLPVNHDTQSWLTHSANVCLARRCALFESLEYKRGYIDYDKVEDSGIYQQRDTYNHKYIEPKKHIEKQRVFEFIVKGYSEECNTYKELNWEDMESIAMNLETYLHNNRIDDEIETNENDKDLSNVLIL